MSSVDRRVHRNIDSIRDDMFVVFRSPVQWLHTISTHIDRGIKQVICVGPIRVIAQQFSRARTLRERAQTRHASPDIQARLGPLDEEASEFEVWSIDTVTGIEQLTNAL